ncbi:hypothetical protein [Gloeobacter morelensis]|uniref:hypothetical protein n=1 Tax=Gloeobacter morelensis TaxID=2907343 RepID=UPI001E600904|nr:hypothetical protein [Gloeobacter morelensis]UFP97190.1 hypothetical protein ISF26_24015 [Gloeobacter morelensis MG652769]
MLNNERIWGIGHARDHLYAAAAGLTYWVFRCRDTAHSPAVGTRTWVYLESAIRNSSETAATLEDYLCHLAASLVAHLRPVELVWVVRPQMVILRAQPSTSGEISEIQKIDSDCDGPLVFLGWRDMLSFLAVQGRHEDDLIDLLRTRYQVIAVLVRLRFEEDRALGKEKAQGSIDVENSARV